MSKSKTLNLWITQGSQSVIFTELLTYKGHSLRISIKSDAYANQCSAQISIFSPATLQWNPLWTIPHGGMETKTGLHYAPDWENSFHFKADRQTLISCMTDIL
jgi:hypothetical protein